MSIVMWEFDSTLTAMPSNGSTDWLAMILGTPAGLSPNSRTSSAGDTTAITTTDFKSSHSNQSVDGEVYVKEAVETAIGTPAMLPMQPFLWSNHSTLNADFIALMPPAMDDNSPNDSYDVCHPENPHFNCTRMEYIEFLLGPQTLPLYKVLLITIIYGGIFLTGVLGNILVCVVIVRHSAMHTATNYYLFSLAMSDLLYLLFGLPMEVFMYWHQYPYLFGLPFCKLRAYISEASTYVSVFTIVAFSVERYLAICHPLHSYTMSGFKRALRIITSLWVVSFLGAVPFGIMTNIIYSIYPPDNARMPESAFCGIETPDDVPLFELSFLIFFFIPMIMIVYFYGRMSAKIRYTTTQQLGVRGRSRHSESRRQQSRKVVIRMLAAVVVTFFICWLPFHVQRLWYIYGRSYSNYQEVNEWLFSFTGFAYYVSCTINPILYNVMSHRYRLAFKDILCGRRKKFYYSHSFIHEPSSFRKTTALANSSYDPIQTMNGLVDGKPLPSSRSADCRLIASANANTVIVCLDNGIHGHLHGRLNEDANVEESLLKQISETSI